MTKRLSPEQIEKALAKAESIRREVRSWGANAPNQWDESKVIYDAPLGRSWLAAHLLDAVDQLRAELQQRTEEVERLREARPKVICLSGSTRFIDGMAVLAWELEKQGAVVLACHLLPAWYTRTEHHLAEEQHVAEALDALHLRKIDMADEVVVCDWRGYIGTSCRREIAYAEQQAKPIRYVSREPELAALAETGKEREA